MRSPSRFGKPALGIPLTRIRRHSASSRRIFSSACGPSVQFAPMTCTFFARRAAAAGRRSPYVVPSSEIGKLGNDGQAGKRANRVDGQKNFFDVRKSFENKEIDAALFQRKRLLVENVKNFVWLGMARLHAETERADRTGDEDFAGSRFAGFARDFYAAAN